MRKLLQHFDKFALAGCVVLFLVAALWATRSFRQVDAIAALNPASGVTPVKMEPHLVPVPAITAVSWPEPVAQSRGSEWVYDTFTPPVLYFDQITGVFTVVPPVLDKPVVVVAETPFEVELVSVLQEPYRIQLVGYASNDGDFIAHLENLDSGAVVLSRPGATYPEAKGNFTLRSFEVKRITTSSTESMPVIENVGVAVIVDGRTGREVTLTTRERLMLPRLQCVLRTRNYPPEQMTLREGMKVTVNGFDYLVIRLSLSPAEADVSRRAPNSIGGAETRTLYPVGEIAPSTGGATAPLARDNSIDSPRVSLFSNIRREPSVDRPRLLTQ